MTYTSSSIRTTHSLCLPTSKYAGSSGFRSSSAHSRSDIEHLVVAPVQLARDLGSQRGDDAGHRHALEHLVEEAHHDQPLRNLRRDAAALQVEALVLVDRADGRRVAALHVVVLDLQVGVGVRPRTLGELDVAVGLERGDTGRLLPDVDEAGVDGLRPTLDRALE